MSPEVFMDFYVQLQDSLPEMLGAALISNGGMLLYQEGEMIADSTLIGVAGAAVMQLAEHIASGLAECPAQEITIRCEKHAALFVPVTTETLLMLVLPAQTDTRDLTRVLRAHHIVI
jgi:predicted regulator of Ras-like GTPase activity (Roadblock/LC7/MglB family)